MNKERRKQIKTVVDALNALRECIEDIHDEEEAALYALPESFEGTERYEAMEEAVTNISDAMDSIDDAIDSLDCAAE